MNCDFSKEASPQVSGNTMVKIKKMATLCDEPVGLTCSVDAARGASCAEEIIYCPSFEAGADLVKRRQVEALLVPGAYPGLNALIMDEGLEVFSSFVRKIPALVYAVGNDFSDSELPLVSRIDFHPAVKALLPEVPNVTFGVEFFEVSSNSEACKMMLESEGYVACVTNSICSGYYQLKVVKVLRSGVAMPWIMMRSSC